MLLGEYGSDNNLAINGNSAWCGTQGGTGLTRVFHSTDRGQTWKVSAALSGLGNDLVSTTFATTTLGWAQGSNGSVAKSTDGGATWGSAIATGLSFGGGIQYLGSTAVAVTGGPGGFALSTDNGNSWVQKTVTGVTDNLFALSFLTGGQTGWVVGSNGVVAQWSGTLFVSVEATQPAVLPSSVVLWQNYPNPFNPSTTIRYGLPHKSNVSVTVYNTLGQEVGLFIQGDQEAGYHNVKFGGSGLPSGVYFYRLSAGDFVQTRKLLLLR
jgi:hypothetical protein